MYISNVLKLFLQDTSIESGNSFYLTNLENVIGFIDKNSFKEMKSPTSRDLLFKFLYFSADNEELTHHSFANNRINVIPIMENKTENLEWQSQIIFPIFIDDILGGCLVMVNKEKKFDKDEAYHSMKATVNFVTKLLLTSIREQQAKERLEELENEEKSDSLFTN